MTGDLTLTTADGPMRVYEATPTSTPRGGVVVVQEAFGVNAHIEEVTRRFAAAGYHALAPDLFHRSGGGTAAYGDFDTVMKLFDSVRDDDAILVDIGAAVDHLAATGITNDHIGVVGFCFGGRVSFLVALHDALGAAVGFYGGGIVTARRPQFPPLVERATSLQTPWLGLFGDEDASIPVEDIERLRTALGAASVETEVVRYPGAKHGFHCDVRDDYNAEAADDAWARTVAWFDRHLP